MKYEQTEIEAAYSDSNPTTVYIAGQIRQQVVPTGAWTVLFTEHERAYIGFNKRLLSGQWFGSLSQRIESRKNKVNGNLAKRLSRHFDTLRKLKEAGAHSEWD